MHVRTCYKKFSDVLAWVPFNVRQLVCEICGESFTCEGFLYLGCWCSKVKVSKEKRVEISQKATDCVCPKCLKD